MRLKWWLKRRRKPCSGGLVGNNLMSSSNRLWDGERYELSEIGHSEIWSGSHAWERRFGMAWQRSSG